MVRSASAATGGLLLLLTACGPAVAQEAKRSETPAKPSARPEPAKDEKRVKEAVDRLVEQLRRHPARPSDADKRVGLYLFDLETREVTLIADEPEAGLRRIGSPTWSHDGRRILFDVMPNGQVPGTRLKVIELEGGKLAMNDLGLGNCPSFSPDDSRIVFLLNTAQRGVWVMHADGSNRRHLGSYGRPLWSPDSHQFMIVDFNLPRNITMMDIEPEKSGTVELANKEVYPEPYWIAAGTIVAGFHADDTDTIAVVDVHRPGNATVKDVLWRRSDGGPDVKPYYPVYSPRTGRCVFVGVEPNGRALYSFRRGQRERPTRLEPGTADPFIQDIALSPDGRYVLFSSSRAAPRPAGTGRGGDAGAKRDDARPARPKTP